MSDRFAWDPLAIRAALRALGFDADITDAWSVGTLRARRDRGDRTCLLAIDAAGRLRAELSAVIEESGGETDAGGVPLRVVATTERVVTITGTLRTLADLGPAIAAIEDIARPDPPALQPPPWKSSSA